MTGDSGILAARLNELFGLGLDAPAHHRIDVIDDAAMEAALAAMADELDDLGEHDSARDVRQGTLRAV